MKKLLYILLFVPFTFLGQNTAYIGQDVPLFLPEGWSMFGYSCFESKDIVEAFEPIVDNVIIVKDYSGAVYMTEFGFNGIGNLEINRGYQIKTSAEITDFSFCPIIAPQYQLGVNTEGGIVFYVDETGERGLVAALEDLGQFEWGCYGTSIVGADGTAIGLGLQNTLDIVAGCTETPIAASEALAYVSEGYSDWYLPSKDELLELYNLSSHFNLSNFATNDTSFYWSSSEINSYDIWNVLFNNGNSYYNFGSSKYYSHSVRPIRAFGYTLGCMDSLACNFNPSANMVDGSCTYLEEGYDCDGNELSENYEIGDLVEGGIVFYIDETGEHGLVAAIEDLTEGATDPYGWGYNGYEWGCYGTSLSGAEGQAIGTGYQNTLDIVAGCSDTNTAAFNALNASTEGYTDWYLPSFDELYEMYNTIGNGGSAGDIGGFDDTWYWSSSEYNYNNAWFVYFSDGYSNANDKVSTYRVRIIRAF